MAGYGPSKNIGDDERKKPLEAAIFYQNLWRLIGLVSIGLLGGICLLKLIYVTVVLHTVTLPAAFYFLDTYCLWALGSEMLLYVVIVLSFVAILDWFDFGHGGLTHFIGRVSSKRPWPATIIILVIFVLYLCLAPENDMFILKHSCRGEKSVLKCDKCPTSTNHTLTNLTDKPVTNMTPSQHPTNKTHPAAKKGVAPKRIRRDFTSTTCHHNCSQTTTLRATTLVDINEIIYSQNHTNPLLEPLEKRDRIAYWMRMTIAICALGVMLWVIVALFKTREYLIEHLTAIASYNKGHRSQRY